MNGITAAAIARLMKWFQEILWDMFGRRVFDQNAKYIEGLFPKAEKGKEILRGSAFELTIT
jgi:hypothetical protein